MTGLSLRACIIALALALAPASALAKTHTISDSAPVATIAIPDDWDVTEIARGIEVDSEDEEVFLAVEVTDLRKVEDAVRETLTMLQRRGVEADPKTEKQRDVMVNGMPGFDISWSGKDKDGPTQISLMLLEVSPTKALVVTYWATPEGTKDNEKALLDILGSLKPVR